MKTLEELRKEVVDAKKAYDKFIQDNSRELTDEEKLNEPDYPAFDESKTKLRIFELTADKLLEFNDIYKKMENSRKIFILRARSKEIK